MQAIIRGIGLTQKYQLGIAISRGLSQNALFSEESMVFQTNNLSFCH